MVFLLCDKVCKIDYSFLGFIGLKNKKKLFSELSKTLFEYSKTFMVTRAIQKPKHTMS